MPKFTQKLIMCQCDRNHLPPSESLSSFCIPGVRVRRSIVLIVISIIANKRAIPTAPAASVPPLRIMPTIFNTTVFYCNTWLITLKKFYRSEDLKRYLACQITII